MNAAYNPITKNKIALYWLGENGKHLEFSFFEINRLSNQFGNLLKDEGVKKGERVFFFLPRVPELYYGFLGTLKIGAVAGTLFAAFGSSAIFERLYNSEARVLITNKILFPRLDKIKKNLPNLKKIILIENLDSLLSHYSVDLKLNQMKESDPAFMLFTSATGNTPVSGIVIPHGGIKQQVTSARLALDLKENDIYWCTADPGWVTGVVYSILTPWIIGTGQVVFEGRFGAKAWYQIIQDYKVNVLYTAPTALRMLQKEGILYKKFKLDSLRYLASVGEALSPALIKWGKSVFGRTIHDTWWQTETGAILLANRPGLKIKPGSMGKPLPGIKAAILNEKMHLLLPGKTGNLALKRGWPAMMTGIWKKTNLYKKYFFGNWFLTGDQAYTDKDGYFWFVGRKSEIIKTSGERVGTFEVESVLDSHPAIAETAVIGKPDELRGEIIKAFIVLKSGQKPSEKLKEKIQAYVKTYLAGHAYPREIEFIKNLPKNRSGKILRRILKAKELGLPPGDTSTLET